MVDHDSPADGDRESVSPGHGAGERRQPRRSTWTPPTSTAGVNSLHMSDDALASALEEDLERATHTGTINVSDELEPEPDSVREPVLDIPPVPDAPLAPPVRRSLPTLELAAALAEKAGAGGDSSEIMATLEEQLRLRQQDATDFRTWQESVESDASPEIRAEVSSVRADFGDVLDTGHPVPPAEPAKTLTDVQGKPEATHTFRMDEVLDSDLSRAPAPMTPPISDLPPPPGHELMFPPKQGTPPMHTAPTIPDLVEPTVLATPPVDSFDFDSLLSGTPAVDGEGSPAVFATDGHPDAGADSILDDDVAENDQAFADLLGPFPVTSEGVAILPEAPAAPIPPIASPRIPMTEHVVMDGALIAPAAFRVEESSVEPTATDHRIGRASRLFWLWFAANSSIVSLAFGGALLSLGMSLRQAIVATLVGVAVSFLPLGLGTLAGKWTGQPTMVVSRATFGHLGNILPAILALLVRVFWGAVLLWFLAAGTARILVGAKLAGPFSEPQVTAIGLAVGFLLALVIAFFGYGLIARIQLAFTIVSGAFIVGLILITWPAVDITTALTVADGPWILVLTGSVLVFSFVGLVWAVSSADLARYQRAGSTGAASMLWSTFGATIPAFVLIAYGALLAASNPRVATGLVNTPLDTIALLIPTWYPIPLVAALAVSLLSGVVISIYSGGFALQATGITMRRSAGVVIVGGAVAVAAILIAVSVGDFTLILRDVATSLAVPIAAWAGIFGAEMMIRSRSFSSQSLLMRGGVYPDFQWINLAMLVVASVIGFGLTTAGVEWLSWQGYLFPLLGIPISSEIAASDLGVFIALILGLLTPIIAGIPGIRRQEESGALRSRTPGD
ncbi:MAG: cytosine permease [Terrimesophilobacter sp.]